VKAAVLYKGRMSVEEVQEPVPAAGQVLVAPLACGVCGSDLHARDHGDHLCNLLHRAGFRGFMDPDRPVVMGHEFCAALLEPSAGLPVGQRVVAQPFLVDADGLALIGYSNRYNGAFAERMLLQRDALIAVPDQVPTDVAAMTEPLAVAVHAVNQSGADKDCAFAVYGCGPVGLFIIARLKALGLGPVLAIDPLPSRRAMAERLGADAVIAPDGAASTEWWRGHDLHIGLSDTMAAASGTTRRAVLFECVGKPGMLTAIAEAAPVAATVVVAGVCMETDAIEPALLIQKSIQLRFVFAYSPQEFAEAFAMICARPEALAPMLTGETTLTQVDRAFAALTAGGEQVKMMVKA
jgi:threonine dehydrogenase-like Zn-dependent dehydrogenase